jgi:lipopolysaccharide transport system permease protein
MSSTTSQASHELLEALPQAVAAPAPAGESPVVVVDERPTLPAALREAWESRRLLPMLASTALGRYARKYRLGATWLVFNTLLGIFGLSFIFGGGVFGVQAPNGMPYFLFVTVGMMGWRLFNSTLSIATRSFNRLGVVVRNVHVPLVFIPIAGSAIALFEFGIYMGAYGATILYYWLVHGHLYLQLEPRLLMISLLGLTLCMTFAWGITLWTAPLTAWARDVRMVVKHILPFWMFLTPVVYPIEKLHGKARLLAEVNPLSSAVEMVKVGLLGSGAVRFYAGIWSIFAISFVFVGGLWFVNRYGPTLVGLRDKSGGDDFDDDDDDML